MNVSPELKQQYLDQYSEELDLADVPDFGDIKARVECRIEGMVSKAITDQIAFTVKEHIEQLIVKPDFNQKLQDHILKLVETMQQVTFRKT